jgi:CheY-like chemotaxis protein
VLLSEEGGELLAKADASFPRERAKLFASHPPAGEFRLPADLGERVLGRQETVVRQVGCKDSALADPAEWPAARNMAQLCLPLIHQGRTIGVLYLESEREQEAFTPGCVSVTSMLASQAAVSFESAQLFEALRETNMWMVKGQELGRMGSYRWNTRTLLSRGSRECYRILGLDLDVNPVPFQAFRGRVHPDDLPSLEQALAVAVNSIGYRAEPFASAETALMSSSLFRFDCVIADVHMPGMGGLGLVQKLHEQGMTTPVILITALPDRHLDDDAILAGAQCLLRKPFQTKLLIDCVERSLSDERPQG